VVSKVAITNPEGRILMVKVTRGFFTGCWTLPGGFVDYAEHPRKGAEREVLEELGINISIADPKGESGEPVAGDDGALIQEAIFQQDGINWISFTYKCHADIPTEDIVPKDDEIEEVWGYLGGCIPLILKMLSYYRRGVKLKEYLEEEKWFAYTEIVDYLSRGGFTEEEEKKFEEIAKEILERGYFRYDRDRKEYLPIIEKWAEKEILFYDPLELKVTGNSRIYEKGMELLLERR
jgi:ADP-ribose pyrophosphatase YjhB (NUDIX family)